MNRLERFLKALALLLPLGGILLLLFTDVLKYVYAGASIAAGLYIFVSTKKAEKSTQKPEATETEKRLRRESIYNKIIKITVAIIWAAVIIFAVTMAKNMGLEEILAYTPESPALAALLIIGLFALKSMSVVIHSGLLYALTGILFPLPAAILIGIAGTMTAFTVPYLLGRRLGAEYVERLVEENPKLQSMREMRSDNEFLFVFFVRLLGLPMDLVSMYFGAVKIRYPAYILAGVLGMLPHSIPYIVMGMSAEDAGSPTFLISLGVLLLTMAGSAIYTARRKRR